jgi:hypothetical protein
MQTAVTLERVSLGYEAGLGRCRARVVVFRRLDLHVARGEIIGVVGRHGVGKTTLLLAAAGLLRPLAGTVRWFDARSRVAEPYTPATFASGSAAMDLVRRGAVHKPRLYVLDDPPAGRCDAATLRAWIERRRAAGDAFLLAARHASALRPLAPAHSILDLLTLSRDGPSIRECPSFASTTR